MAANGGSLKRSTKNRVVAGVCGGLAEYFGIDSTIVRIVFIFLTLVGGGGIFLYILLWLFIPSSDSKLDSNVSPKRMVKLAVVIVATIFFLIFFADFIGRLGF